MNTKVKMILASAFCFLVFFSAAAQPQRGKLDTWTTKPVEQPHESAESTYIRTVRAAKQKGFDRVVFEFKGPLPNYSVEYHSSRWYEDEGGRRRLKLAGSAFVQINLHTIPVDEEQLKLSQAKDFYPRGRLKLPSLSGVEEATFFEGYYTFFLGVKTRKPFRVTELSNPSRLVIDFKH
jgi:hypothetical protein